jgi:acetylornithine deacetylase/succinyl-diaminopimelate desuccinylase-like protein
MGPIEAVAAKVFPGVPVTPMQETFGTDAGRLVAVGIPTYGFSALFRGDDAGNIHGLNEHIAVSSVMDGRTFMYRLIKAYAEQK